MHNPKQVAGRRAAEFVQPGMRVGLGTGSTVYFALERLAERVREGLTMAGVPTSVDTQTKAQAMGIPLLPTKLIAFMTGAAFSGVMGVIYGAQRTFVSPESFTLLASITILAMVILGGMGSIPGAILGAAALTILNLDILKTFSEFVRTSLPWIPSQVDPAKYERLVFGLILILMMIYRPQGLIPEARHRAELEEEA